MNGEQVRIQKNAIIAYRKEFVLKNYRKFIHFLLLPQKNKYVALPLHVPAQWWH
jgi:hypothetical protein